jgi:nucleoporin NUP82
MSIQLYKCIIYARTKLLSRNSLQLQQKEQQRQLVQLYEIYKRINELSSPTEQEKRIKALEKVARKDKKLSLRADSILQKLLDKSQPELSVYEKRWIEELQRLQKIVEGESGFRGRVKKVRRDDQ